MTRLRGTAARPKVYVQKHIACRWRLEAKAAETVLAFSPYVTSPIAQQVLQAAFGECELYTLFSAKNFATKASSLKALEQLIDAGVKVYHLPDLHAKILLVPGRSVTIGSQNLTRKGKTNKEASVLLTNQAVIQQVLEEVAPWLETRVPVTKEMIADMRAKLAKIRKLFAAAEEEAQSLDEEVKSKQEARDRERQERERRERDEREQRQREAENRDRLRRLVEDGVRRARVARETVYGVVTPYNQTGNMSLIAPADSTYTKWVVDGEERFLTKTERYLCIHENTCKLGWARVVKSRITFVGRAVSEVGTLDLLGSQYTVSLMAQWDEGKLATHNLEVQLRGPAAFNLECVFSLGELEIVGARWSASASSHTQSRLDLLCATVSGVRDRLTDLLVEPFTYKTKLHGVWADKFFGREGTRCRTRLAFVRDKPVLTTKRIAESWTLNSLGIV